MTEWGPLWAGNEEWLRTQPAQVRERGRAARDAALVLTGLSEDEALRGGEAAGMLVRVGVRDGRRVLWRPDLMYERVNLHVEAGTVTDVSIA